MSFQSFLNKNSPWSFGELLWDITYLISRLKTSCGLRHLKDTFLVTLLIIWTFLLLYWLSTAVIFSSEFASGPGQAAFPRRLLTLLLWTSNAHRCLSDYNVALALFVSVTDRPTEGGGGHELRIHWWNDEWGLEASKQRSDSFLQLIIRSEGNESKSSLPGPIQQ